MESKTDAICLVPPAISRRHICFCKTRATQKSASQCNNNQSVSEQHAGQEATLRYEVLSQNV